MKFKDFQLPQKIKWVNEKDNYGRLICEPFERGYGHTIGNSLRRILLASLEGAVITSVKIKGAHHEFSTIKGIKEDVLEIIFNLKQLRFKMQVEENQRIILDVSDKKNITGKDFKLNSSVELLNPDTHIATMNEEEKLYLEATVARGRGYNLASSRQEKITDIDEIPIDAAFSPVRKVNYFVENARVGQATDYDRLVLDVWTDGGIKPSETVTYAARVLKRTLDIFEVVEIEDLEIGEGLAKEKEAEEEIKKLPLKELKITTRIENILNRVKIKTIGDLLEKSEGELLKIEKLGKKSIEEIKERLDKLNKEKGAGLEFKS